MTYEEAILLRKEHLSMIGAKDAKGVTINEIIIVPSNEQFRKIFFENYLLNKNAEISIKPFIREDLEVWAIDLTQHQKNGLLGYKNLSQV